MRIKLLAGLMFSSIVISATGAFIGNADVYILGFLLLTMEFSMGILLIISELTWKLLTRYLNKTYESTRIRFDRIFLLSVLLFYIFAGTTDKLYLNRCSEIIIWSGRALALIFALFLGSSLIRRGSKETFLKGTTVFLLFFAILSILGYRSDSDDIPKSGSVEKLMTLGYIEWAPADGKTEKTGVTLHDPAYTFNNLNMYCSRKLQKAYLLDMEGNVVHTWAREIGGSTNWHHVEMYRNGDLLVIAEDENLLLLNWHSDLKWKRRLRVHHDLCIDENGKIYALTRERGIVFWHWLPVPILDDFVAVFSATGELEAKVQIYQLIKERMPFYKIVNIYRFILSIFEPANLLGFSFTNYKLSIREHSDFMHINSIDIMDRDIDGFCRKGDWLISMRHMDLVGLVDPVHLELKWSWGPGELSWQHDATLLENDNILIFDNGMNRNFSRIVELDPRTKTIVWEYKSDPPDEFFTSGRGGSQRLPNGNTLITESNKGHVFEITRDGRAVWEFYNYELNPRSGERAPIYRMNRLTDPVILNLIRD